MLAMSPANPLFFRSYMEIIEQLEYLDELKAESNVLNYLHCVSRRKNLKSLDTHTNIVVSLDTFLLSAERVDFSVHRSAEEGRNDKVPNMK